MNQPDYNESVNKFFKAIKLLRDHVNKELTIQQISVYLKVVMHEGITMRNLAEELNQHQTSISRHVKEFSRYFVEIDGQYVERGYQLLTTAPNEYNRREYSVYLTEFGKKIANEINIIFGTISEVVTKQDNELFKQEDIFDKIVKGNKLLQGFVSKSSSEFSKENNSSTSSTKDLKFNDIPLQPKCKSNPVSSDSKTKKTNISTTTIMSVETNHFIRTSNSNDLGQLPKSSESLDLSNMFRNRAVYCAEKLAEMNYDENAGANACTEIYKLLISKLKTDLEDTYGPFTIRAHDTQTVTLTNISRLYNSIKKQFELLTKNGRNSDKIRYN